MSFLIIFFSHSGTPYIPAVWAAPLSKKAGKYPVIVFSHGLGACKFFYSGTYAELASHGFVVAALEHRDTSACATFYYASPKDHAQSKRTWIKHHKMGFGHENFPARVKQVILLWDEIILRKNTLTTMSALFCS